MGQAIIKSKKKQTNLLLLLSSYCYFEGKGRGRYQIIGFVLFVEKIVNFFNFNEVNIET